MKQLVKAEVPENTKPYIFNTRVAHTGYGERPSEQDGGENGWLRGGWAPFPVCVLVENSGHLNIIIFKNYKKYP